MEERKEWTFDHACNTMETTSIHPVNLVISSEQNDLISLLKTDKSDLVLLGSYKDDDDDDDKNKKKKALVGFVDEVDRVVLGGALDGFMEEESSMGKVGFDLEVGKTSSTIRVLSSSLGEEGEGSKMKKYSLIGLGEKEDDKEKNKGLGLKIGSAIASKCSSENGIKSCTVLLPVSLSYKEEEEAKSTFIRDISSSLYLGLHSDNRYRTGDNIKINAKDMETVTLVFVDETDGKYTVTMGGDDDEAISEGKKLSFGTILAKDIVNAPHNVLNSESMANVARKIAAESDGVLSCVVLGKKECEERGMGAYLGVARGSETQPQFIHLTYKPLDGDIKRKVGLVGKGVAFDTGGYNIKVAMMELMKFDCGGASAVLGAAKSISEIEPAGIEVHFIVPACENMINEKAYVPSDILRASNGTTIEVLNTDAEGRLTLADALVYADKEIGCETIIELSTLTGATLVSLGWKVSAVYSDDDDLVKEISDASSVTGEKTWRMPLVKEYNEDLKSKIADVKNIGIRWGGAITAALFLNKFVDTKRAKFAHIDMPGPVWSEKSGATGYGAQLLTEWVRQQSNALKM